MSIASSLPVDPATIGLLVALAAVLIVGMKVVQTVVSTVIISVFCAGFYVVSAILLDYTLTINRVLQFAVLGSSLYFGFKTVSGVYGAASTAVSLPMRVVSALTYPVGKLVGALTSGANQDSEHDEEDSQL
nr:MAG: hypothetical protein J07AB56_04490 [Candidatus Nanosalinarum sp. J07AB56]